MSNFTEIRPAGDAMIHVDGHDVANTRASRLCKRAQKVNVGRSRDTCVTLVFLQGRKIQLVRDNSTTGKRCA